MKKILAILTGMAFTITLGLAFAVEDMSGSQGTGDKIIRDEDIQQLQLDQDRATVNQMAAEPGSEGSGAGGASTDSDTMYKDSDQYTAPVEKTPAKPGIEGSGAGGVNKDSDTMHKDSDQYTAPVEKTPAKPGIEGSGAGGSRDDSYSPGY